MLESLLVTFREGVEAFLIIAIAAGYLTQTGRKYLLTPLFSGVLVAVILSYAFGTYLESFADTAEFEGSMAMVAAVLVASLTVYVSKNAWRFKHKMQKKLDKADSKDGFFKYAGVFLFAVLMVSREGAEVALLMNVISYEHEATQMYIGSALGLLVAFGLGIVWIKYNHLINIGKLLKITSVFLFLFTIHLFIYGLHELSEVSAIPFINNDTFHMATEEIAEGISADIFSYFIVLTPFAYLAYNFLANRRQNVIPS